MKVYTIIVTGSRDWSDYNAIARKLAIALGDAKRAGCEKVIIRHGKCKTGADAYAAEFCNKIENSIPGLSIVQDAMPAHWGNPPDRTAGPKRNQAMIAKGADLCLVFLGACTSSYCKKPGKHPSHGASGCARLAEDANIPTIYTWS